MTATMEKETGQEVKLDKLAQDLIEAKKLEAAANKHRVEIEEQIIAIIGVTPAEGQATTQSKLFKITLKGGLSRKADFAAMRQLEGVPANLMPIKLKEELDVPGLRWLEANMPEIHSKLLTVITTKPMKTSVSVKGVE